MHHHRLVRSDNLSSRSPRETNSIDSVAERDAPEHQRRDAGNSGRTLPSSLTAMSEGIPSHRRCSISVLDLPPYHEVSLEVALATALGHWIAFGRVHCNTSGHV